MSIFNVEKVTNMASQESYKDEEELALEKLVFGDSAGFEANLRKIENLYDSSDDDVVGGSESDHSDDDKDSDGDGDMFFIDNEGNGDIPDLESNSDEDIDDNEAAWHDSDDERAAVSVVNDRAKKLRRSHDETALSGPTYVARLRAQFEKIYPRPEWVDSLESEDIEETESTEDEQPESTARPLDDLLNSTNTYVKTKQALLPPTRLLVTRLKDANIARRAQGPVLCLSFHTLHPLLLTGGMDKSLRVFYIDGKSNPLVSLVFLKDIPVRTCHFLPTPLASVVYAAGRRRYMARWNAATGEYDVVLRLSGQEPFQRSFEYFKMSPLGSYVALLGSNGYINLVSCATAQLARALKVDGYLADYAFTADEKTLIAVNFAGEVWEFDLTADDVHVTRRWADSAAVSVTHVALGGPDDRWLAIGTKSGVVNIFDRLLMDKNDPAPTPLRSVGNLVTNISHLVFSPDGQILCILSKQTRDALKLVHLPTATVFANWPTSATPLGRPTYAAFSPNGQMLAIANDAGKVTLWRLNHY